MEKPKPFIHGDHRAGRDVLVVGRVAIPVLFFGIAWVIGGVVAVGLLITAISTQDPSFMVYPGWFFGLSLAALVSVALAFGIFVLTDIYKDVNGKDL